MIQEFVDKFRDINNVNEFYGFTPYIEGTGFSIKKDLSETDVENSSLISFYIQEDTQQQSNKKMIVVDVAYGPKSGDSVKLRNNIKAFSPLDLVSKDDYYYDISNDKLLKGNKEISAMDLINEIYRKHIKSTRPIRGLWLRTKILFWRVVVKSVFGSISSFFRYALRIMTGDQYSYNPILSEEVLNNTITSHRWKEMIGQKKIRGMKENLIPSAKFDFFGYKASYWIIIFYSMLHLSLYLIFEYENWKPLIITTIFKNSFLTLIYVILTLWIMEVLVPMVFKFIIKKSSIAAINAQYKRIRI